MKRELSSKAYTCLTVLMVDANEMLTLDRRHCWSKRPLDTHCQVSLENERSGQARSSVSANLHGRHNCEGTLLPLLSSVRYGTYLRLLG